MYSAILISLLCVSKVFADPYTTNWTAVNYLPNPKVNGPSCIIPNNAFGWNTLKNVDGTLYTASKRPIVITAEGWDSYFLNAYVAQYLLEAMGYQTFVAQTGRGYVIGPEFYVNAIDLFLEAWPEDTASYEQMTQVDRVAVDMGATGYSGVIGLYVPTPLVEKYPAFGLDFWRFLLNPEARALFPESRSTPPYLVDGKPHCDGNPKLCVDGYYTPAQCKVPGAKCIELWAYDPSYSPKNVRINVYIIFLAFLCATRIYWQPYHNAMEAYLNREISLGILVMIAFRQYTDHYGVSTASLAQIGIIVFLPVVLHMIRWFRSNVEKHQDKIASVLATASITTKASSHSVKSPNGSSNSLSSKLNSPYKKKNSIEKVVTQKIVRTTSMLDKEKKGVTSQPPSVAANVPPSQASSGAPLSKVSKQDQ